MVPAVSLLRRSLGQSSISGKYFWGHVWRSALNLLFPPACPLCREPAEDSHALCSECFNRMHFISRPACICCGQPFPHAMGEGALCASCLDVPPAYDKAWSVFSYDEHSRHLVTRLKFSDRTDLAPLLGKMLAQYGADVLEGRTMMLPVPLHRRRLLTRRYNQSLLLARILSQRTGVPLLVDALRRTRHTTPQTGLTRKERQSNVSRAFVISPRYEDSLKGQHVLLVDDVLTTGATIAACAKALRKSGVASIHVLTAARRFPVE